MPTIAQAAPGFDVVLWLGIIAPAINETIARPEIASEWARQGAPRMTMTPAEFDAFLRKDIEKWERVARFSGALSQ